MSDTDTALRAPSRLQTAAEVLSLLTVAPAILRAPRHLPPLPDKAPTVWLFPGYSTGDWAMGVLRRHLHAAGFAVRPWGLGTNHGNLKKLIPAATRQIEAAAASEGPQTIVGWSLGGSIVREVARDRPDLLKQIITLGSPVVGGAKYTAVASVYVRQGIDLDRMEQAAAERARTPIRVPIVNIYTRRDGIVGWRASLDTQSPQVRQIEVRARHCALGCDPETIRLVIAALRGELD